ncbi:hypothetical protein ACT4R9_05560 [Ornithobacterium rhinotracheale]|uniref:hypothetical protein n=1 Tax=Ornithobacterium rhinotracheale TaxID=28251 RepID=UPI003FA4BECE
MKKRIIQLNSLQMISVQALNFGRKNIFIEAGRGAGKSTILAYYITIAVKEMPRATGILVGATFTQIKTRTFMSTKEGLELFGLYEGVDYVVGRCGRSLGFEMPFQSPDNWSNVIHFANGHIIVLVSLDDPNSGRGLNSYYVIGDEAALLRHERLFDNVLTTNRAKKVEFEKAKMLNAQIYTSTVALTHVGKWFTDGEKLARQNPEKYSFIKANALVNKMNLKEGWFEDMRAQAESEVKFNAEIMNIRPPAVPDGFYASLSPKNFYSNEIKDAGSINLTTKIDCLLDQDLIRTLPLEVSLDFGGRINVAVISQYHKLSNTRKFINEFYVKNPDILSDLVKKIIDYYAPIVHSSKTIYLLHDRSGYKTETNSKTTLARDVEDQLRSAGWKVFNNTPNTNNPSHTDKFNLINRILAEEESTLPKVRINQDKCPNLLISMENAGLKHKDDQFEKDKSSERQSIPQEHATHLSDAFDYSIWWNYHKLLDPYAQSSYLVSSI